MTAIQSHPTRADVERIALVILNSDRSMAGFAPVSDRAEVPDSDGYAVNARAVLAALVSPPPVETVWSRDDVRKLLEMVPSLDREDDWHDAVDRWRTAGGDAAMEDWLWWWRAEDDEAFQDESVTRDEALAAARLTLGEKHAIVLIEARSWADDFSDLDGVVPFAATRNIETITAAPTVADTQ